MIIVPLYRRGSSGTARKQERQDLNPGSLIPHCAGYTMNWESGELSSWASPAICLLCDLQKSSQLSGPRPLLITSLKASSFEFKSSCLSTTLNCLNLVVIPWISSFISLYLLWCNSIRGSLWYCVIHKRSILFEKLYMKTLMASWMSWLMGSMERSAEGPLNPISSCDSIPQLLVK